MADMSMERALAIVRELGEHIGGEQGVAVAMVVSEAERVPMLSARLSDLRGRKSSTNLQAVGAAALGAQHFARATADLQEVSQRIGGIEEELTQGLAAVQRGARVLREEEVGPVPTEDLPER
jgi:hypothetical protein